MQVQDIMVRDAKVCHADTNLAEAAAIMWTNGCGALPVVDAGERVVGVITDRDICIAAGTRVVIPQRSRSLKLCHGGSILASRKLISIGHSKRCKLRKSGGSRWSVETARLLECFAWTK